ncbi:glutamyl-tRNA reductase [Syntrophobacter fumaroxidans]|uniref:Glutamyl-tRNA reductase n=1 Tax=Syntrophobacter fumaroxidans (strain DSM 10017 / MPOB) TaxID=335543 RepID=HEM1_SYNFM|nr:glutamyl-tRNA reductase [Syntrophobacter fumaroxidans]A0LIM5.1 RecName: Full=Glutamyl-tRNA reductase; Short=GluTR [Syntrophobacter fumaroxidans MPOB]ABK17277.1 glutamyl-tRNA reductase [Syntrophobacter fumaroxidans MPOB]
MCHIILLGMNHKTAPVEMRERLAVACRQEVNPLRLLPRLENVDELLFLSTCNRVEFLFTCRDRDGGLREVTALLRTYLGLDSTEGVENHVYAFRGMEAVRHVFRVASSLDSMVVGEPQILGQLKSAYREATEWRTVKVILNRLLHKTFSVAKRVRSETCIGSNAVSISYAAVELAKKIFGSLQDKRVLLIGAGEMAELAAEHLLAQGVRHMVVANRTLERAVDLAKRFRAETTPFDHILNALKNTDIVLSSTGAPEPILKYNDVRARMRERRNKPLFFIDIAVPRDIDPKINEIDNVYLYDIDDLQGVIDLNREERKREAERAEHIIAGETLKFQEWMATLNVVPTIVALREKAETIRRSELQRTLSHLPHMSEKDRLAVEALTEAIVKKLLHDPIVFLKKKADRSTKDMYVDYTQQLFNLADGDDGEEAPAVTVQMASAGNDGTLLKTFEPDKESPWRKS